MTERRIKKISRRSQKLKAGKPRKRRGVRQRYDWAMEKVDFFNSEIDEVKLFFTVKHSVYSPHIQANTAGWSLEKRAWKKEQAERLLREIADNRVRVASTVLNKILKIVAEDIDRIDQNRKTLSQEPVSALWRIVRTEAGLPSAINKQENVDLDKLDDARKLLDDKLKNEQTSIPKPRGVSKDLPKSKPPGKPKP